MNRRRQAHCQSIDYLVGRRESRGSWILEVGWMRCYCIPAKNTGGRHNWPRSLENSRLLCAGLVKTFARSPVACPVGRDPDQNLFRHLQLRHRQRLSGPCHMSYSDPEARSSCYKCLQSAITCISNISRYYLEEIELWPYRASFISTVLRHMLEPMLVGHCPLLRHVAGPEVDRLERAVAESLTAEDKESYLRIDAKLRLRSKNVVTR